MDTIKKEARVAGLLYFAACIIAPFALIYLPSILIVPGDATATANRLRASETLLRLGIGTEMISPIIVIFAVLALYRLFKRVNENHAIAMATLMFISVPIALLNVLNEIAALVLVSGAAFLSSFDQGQRDTLAYLFLRLHLHGVALATIFWGLWLFPFGLLVMRSGFMPRIVGVFLMIAGFGYLASSFTALVFPTYARLVGQFAMVLYFGELPIFWFLIWGVKEQRSGRGGPVQQDVGKLTPAAGGR